MPLRIRVSNLHKKRKINKNAIKKAALKVFGSFKRRDALIDITFVTNRRIKTLNKKYMHRNTPTDVLSFSLEGPSRNTKILGDVYISSDMAYSNARRFKTSFTKEVLLYTVHGMLHLLGFEDKTVKEKKRIRSLEENFLKKILWKSKILSRA